MKLKLKLKRTTGSIGLTLMPDKNKDSTQNPNSEPRSCSASKDIPMTSAHIEQLNKTLDKAINAWHYYAHDIYNSQLSIIKNYLWFGALATTSLVALFEKYSAQMSVSTKWILTGAIISSLLVLILGIICLSGMFFPKFNYPHQVIYYKAFDDQIINKGPESDKYADCLYNSVIQYDDSITQLMKHITRKAHFMRAQCIFCLVSFILGLITLINIS